MAITWAADVAPLSTSLATIPTATQTLILAVVDRQIDDVAWGTFADDGRRFLAAHLGTLYLRPLGAAGPITSETLGAMSRSYGMLPLLAGALGSTIYGAEYERLLRIACGVPGLVV